MVNNELKLYLVYDRVRKEPIIPVLARTDAEACRSVLPTLYSRYPMKDLELRLYGKVHSGNAHDVIPWSVYTMPENEADNLYAMGYSEEQVQRLMTKAANDKVPVSDSVDKEVVNE